MWTVILLDEVDTWYGELVKEDQATAEQVTAAIDKLEADGPSLGRPLVDRIKASTIHALKELRPGSSGTSEVRILFVFIRNDKPCCWLPVTRAGSGASGTTRTSRWPSSVTNVG